MNHNSDGGDDDNAYAKVAMTASNKSFQLLLLPESQQYK